jgi:hypothetical protein
MQAMGEAWPDGDLAPSPLSHHHKSTTVSFGEFAIGENETPSRDSRHREQRITSRDRQYLQVVTETALTKLPAVLRVRLSPGYYKVI